MASSKGVRTHLPYLLEVQLRKCVQPVGQLAQVEKLHLEAGDKGASHREGWRTTSLWRLPSTGGKGKGQECVCGGGIGGQRALGSCAWAWGPGSTDRTT